MRNHRIGNTYPFGIVAAAGMLVTLLAGTANAQIHPWTTAGSTGVVDEADTGIVEFVLGEARVPAVAPADSVLHLRYNVVSLEGFDGIGSYRTHDNGEPINASATIEGKTFSGAQGLGQYIHDNPRYPACVARRLYSYSRGVNSFSVSDFPDAYKAFQDSGFRLRALLKSMASSDSFYAAAPPKPSTATQKKAGLQ